MSTWDAPLRIIVLGAGAIGASIGALLFDLGVPCVLIARGPHGDALCARGVDLRFPNRSRRIRVPTRTTLVEAAPTPNDLVLLATMGQHTESALANLDPGIPVASFQNGLASFATLTRRGHPTLAALVYVPAERREPGVIALAGVPTFGTILLGAWPAGVHRWGAWLVARLVEAGFRAEAESNIAPWIRAKLLVNLGGVVLALSDVPAPDVIAAAQAEARAVWRAADEDFEEVDALMKRVGPLDVVPVDGRSRIGGSTRNALARGEPLETACLHGGIVAAGRLLGIPTPVNEGLIRLAEEAVREGWRPGELTNLAERLQPSSP